MQPPHYLRTTKEYVSVYRKEDVVTERGMFWLPIKLLQRTILLPLVNVADDVHPVGIAWLDPNPQANPELARDAGSAMGLALRRLYAQVVIMPSSTKSEAFIDDAARLAGAQVIKLPGGKDKDVVLRESEPGSVHAYVPVTGVTTYIGLPKVEENKLRAAFKHQKTIVLADDVSTTRATIGAMKELLASYTRKDLPVAVLAREAPFDETYPPMLSEGEHAIIALPEIMGLDPNKLVPIAQKNTIGIPKAIVF